MTLFETIYLPACVGNDGSSAPEAAYEESIEHATQVLSDPSRVEITSASIARIYYGSSSNRKSVEVPVVGGVLLVQDIETGTTGNTLPIRYFSVELSQFELRGRQFDSLRISGGGAVGGGQASLVRTSSCLTPGSQCAIELPGNTLVVVGDAILDGALSTTIGANEVPAFGVLDPVGKQFSLDVLASAGDLDAHLVLVGDLVHQNPVAVAGPDQVVECSSGNSATIVLDGSGSFDRDGDIRSYVWEDAGSNVVKGIFKHTEITQGLGVTEYGLRVTDAEFDWGVDRTTVLVADTYPPVLEHFQNNAPPCLWPPNHKYAVLRVGREFTGLVTDRCDPYPELVITGGTSSQPVDAIGDGATKPDLVVFDDRVCIRSERQGTEREDRIYSINIAARDGSGNESDPVVQIRVPHDQGRSEGCENIDTVEIVGLNDPVCAPPTEPAIERTGGCESGTGSGELGLALVLIAVAIAFRQRMHWIEA